jgi:ankyrin repeat protein
VHRRGRLPAHLLRVLRFAIPYSGCKETCKHFLRNKKIDVDLETPLNKQTPLIVACSEGNYEIVRLLLLGNAEVNKPNAFSYSPLTAVLFRLSESAISFENTKVCFLISDILVSHGADVNWVMDKANGYSLLHFYCSLRLPMNDSQRKLNYKIVKFLL